MAMHLSKVFVYEICKSNVLVFDLVELYLYLDPTLATTNRLFIAGKTLIMNA